MQVLKVPVGWETLLPAAVIRRSGGKEGETLGAKKTLKRPLCSPGEKIEEVESRQFLKQLNIALSHAPTILLLGIYAQGKWKYVSAQQLVHSYS